MARIRHHAGSAGYFSAGSAAAREIVFIDPWAADGSFLAAGVRAGIETVALEPGTPALAQIAAGLRGRSFETVHVVAHGGPGRLGFAAGTVSTETLAADGEALEAIAAALAPDAEIRLWSCETGQGAAGRAFVDALAGATGARVLASTRAVGAQDLGGRWELDLGLSAAVASPSPFTATTMAGYRGLLADRLFSIVDYYDQPNNTLRYELRYVNSDGTNGVTQLTGLNNPEEIVIDAASNRYFYLSYTPTLFDTGVLYTGLLNSNAAPTVAFSFSQTANDAVDNTLGLEIDPINHHLYIGHTDYLADDGNYVQSDATSGIIQIDYNASTGAVSNTSNFIINDAQANTPNGYFFASDIGRDDTDGTIYYVNQSYGLGNNMIYKVDAASHTVTPLLRQSQFPEVSQFSSSGTNSNGVIGDVEVDGAHNLVYFSVQQYEYNAGQGQFSLQTGPENHIYVISDTATGGPAGTLATVLTLNSFPAGAAASFLPQNITLDQANRILYVESEGNPNDSASSDDTIYAFQLANDGLSATYIRTLFPNFTGTQLFGNVQGLEFTGNAAPTLDLDADNSSGAAGSGYQATYTEGGAAAAIADSDASIVDSDDANVASATITLTNHQASDLLAANGVLPGGISASAYNPSTGVITLTGSATLASYQTALRQIVFSNSSDDPNTTGRSITVTVSDGTASSTSATSTIHLTALNDAPTLSATGQSPTFTEAAGLGTQAAAVTVFSGASASTIEAGQTITSLKFTVSGLADGANESVSVDGTSFGLTNGANGTTATNGMTYTVSVAAGTATVTLTKAGGISAASAGTLVNGIGYQDTSTDNPTAGDRVFTLTEIKDSGGSGGGNVDTTALSIASTVHVSAVDDAAVAVNDAVTAVENAVLNGNVLVANPTTADSDVDGPGLSVFAVNGLAGNVGSQITLASGAKLTLNGNGTFAYDPNHAFDALPDFAASGASNTTATDSFTYTLTGGGTATVTVTVRGVDSNDTLHGTVGTDNLVGGAGNDTYYVENGTDTITEANGAGADVVYASVNYTLAAGQEIEILKNGAGATALTLTGNGLDNAIVGGTGADTLIGLGGDDTYYVKNGGVTVTEAGGGGADTVKAAVSWAMQAGQEIELLRADAGSTGITLTGNERANAFISGAGNDTLIGLGGDDTYYVNNAGDLVTEALNGGLDTVKAGVSWAMQAGQEIEKLMANAGATGLTLTGNELSNLLQGNAGADRLIGGLSIDSMIGAGGNDTFVFNTLADSGVTTPDLIYDFSAGDKIDVSAIDADGNGGNGGNGDTAFILDALGDNSFATGHIKQTLSGTSLYLSFNADGDAISEMTIRLLNHPAAIGSGDIIA